MARRRFARTISLHIYNERWLQNIPQVWKEAEYYVYLAAG